MCTALSWSPTTLSGVSHAWRCIQRSNKNWYSKLPSAAENAGERSGSSVLASLHARDGTSQPPPEPSATKRRSSPGGCWRMPAHEHIGQPRELHDTEAVRDQMPKAPRQPSHEGITQLLFFTALITWGPGRGQPCSSAMPVTDRLAAVASTGTNGCDSPFQQKPSVLHLWHCQHRPLQRSTGNYAQVSSRSNSCHKAHLRLREEGNADATSPFCRLTPIASCLISDLQRRLWL